MRKWEHRLQVMACTVQLSHEKIIDQLKMATVCRSTQPCMEPVTWTQVTFKALINTMNETIVIDVPGLSTYKHLLLSIHIIILLN